MNELMIFNNEEFGQVRTITINNEPWFVGKDVAEALKYKNTRQAIATNVSEEDKGVHSIDTLGGKQNVTLINESGLYSLIFGSKLPSAKKFKTWVTSDILPSIRKTGGYVSNDDMFINTYLPFADDTTKALFKTTLTTVRKQNEVIAAQNKQIETQKKEISEQKEEIDHKKDVISGLTDEISLPEMRQVLNKVLNRKTSRFQERWGTLYREFELKYHVNLKIRLENYNIKNKPKCKSKLDYIDKVMNQLPDLYNLACKLYENDIKEMITEMYYIAKTE